MAEAGDASVANDTILLRDIQDGVATLTLNRPRARNALSVALLTALESELAALATDSSVSVLVLAGAGPGFCSGHDLKELRAHPDPGFYQALFRQCSRVMTALVRLPQPVIARVHGVATAAGCQLVASCDLAVAGEEARFATPGVNIGLFCSTPMIPLSRNVGRKAAMEMLLTGEFIGAEKARSIGLVNRVVPTTELTLETEKLARQIADKSPVALRAGKAAFYRQATMDLETAYAYAASVMVQNMMDADAEEGIDAFLEKRPPVWSCVSPESR